MSRCILISISIFQYFCFKVDFWVDDGENFMDRGLAKSCHESNDQMFGHCDIFTSCHTKPKIGRSPISLSNSLRTFKVHIKFHGRPVRSCGPECWLDVKISVIIPRLCCEQHKKCEMSRTVWTTEMLNTSHSNVGSKIMKNINHAWYIHPLQFNVYGTFVLTRVKLFLI